MLDKEQALKDLLGLLAVPGRSGSEKAVAELIASRCKSMPGFSGQVLFDNADVQGGQGGDTGNLIIRFDSPGPKPRLLFSAHMDTIPQAAGGRPVVADGFVRNPVPGKTLGGDCRAGCAVLLQLIRRIAESRGDHPPVTLVFFVQEEIGLLGSRYLDLGKLGVPAPAVSFNFDSEGVNEIYHGTGGAERFHIDIKGIGAHSGINPEDGVSAAIIASHALSALHRLGWHGRINKPEGIGAANIGILQGGETSNAVIPELYAYAEARSNNDLFRRRIVEAWKEAFQKAAAATANARGEHGQVAFRSGPSYDAYAIGKDSPTVRHALAAMAKCKITSTLAIGACGGDANWINTHGIPTVGIGMGAHACHSPEEYVSLKEYYDSCRLAMTLLETEEDGSTVI
jgi:tripeptide aminopeptidase